MSATTQAPTTLVIVPPDPPSEVSVETMLLGMPIVRRTVLAARKAGFEEILFLEGEESSAGAATALEGLAVRFVSSDLLSKNPAPAGAVRLPWNLVAPVSFFRSLRSPAAASTAAAAGAEPAPPGAVIIHTFEEIPRAENLLLQSLIKDTEGFMSRHVERKISLAVSRRLVSTSITPNQMTVFSVCIGVFGSLFFLRQDALFETIGALFFSLHSILDGCDGELARLKFMESRWGGVLDFWGDNVVHSAVFSSMAVGWSLQIHEAWPLLLGAFAVAGTFLSAGFVFVTTMREKSDGPLFKSVAVAVDSPVSRVADALGRRDFIYLVLVFALFGKASWFLVLSAFGAPIFFVVLVFIAVTSSRWAREGGSERKPR